MNKIIEYLSTFPDFNNILNNNKDLSALNDESLVFILACKFMNKPENILIVKENLLAAQNAYNLLVKSLPDNCYLYCVDEVTKFTSLATSPEMQASRIYILSKLLSQEKVIIVTHTMALKRLTPSVDIFKKNQINLKINMEYDYKNLITRLTKLGYKNVLQVSQSFEFSYRGGVIDVFSINYSSPLRIEFFDNVIEDIRFFDVETQRTTSKAKECLINPACEFLTDNLDAGIEKIQLELKKQLPKTTNNLLLEDKVNNDIERILNYDFDESLFKYYAFFNDYGNLLDYFKDYKCYLWNNELIKNNSEFIENETFEKFNELFEEGQSLINLKVFHDLNSILTKIANPIYLNSDLSVINPILDFSTFTSFNFNYDLLSKTIDDLLNENYTIYIGLMNKVHFESLCLYLDSKDYKYKILKENDKIGKGINLSFNSYNYSLDLKKYRLALFNEESIFKQVNIIKNHFSKFKNAITLNSVDELSPGDYVVHEQHGIGLYKGIETIETNNIHRDYLHIEYKNGDILYVSLEQFKLVRKYVSKEGIKPTLNKLGSKEWEKTKNSIKNRVNEIAEKLINLYSLRIEKPGFAHKKDDYLSDSFEQEFGYELTKDQALALKEIKNDMERPIIMDRILCGDVGFGKTEVAFRAAFKAMNSNKQVALLCPTTLLARQHYNTACERFKNYGIKIAMLSRLVSDKQTQQIIKDLKDNKINFLIGTHRILSNDIKFADLGLLIVDEEHKFGVEHKEKIKEFKENVDVLTLTATPIPRTLQMALTGVRGFSTITTPIENRMPVQTYVIEKNKFVVKEIIERELSRGGQVYYLHNRVESLPKIANELQKLIKDAKICIGHGKMSSEEIEDVMQNFINQEYNILVCTTIIENGIDIPNVNTIIVDNADMFGLSSLYQIKGRVGRSSRLAYAYLMYTPNKQLSEIAKKRLQTIKEFTALGSGYKVAMRDLLTRGAGDLLGPEQSGFIDRVGMDMYIEMLHDAIKRQKENKEEVVEEIKAKPILNVDAYIPKQFFNNDYEKIQLYKEIDKVKDIKQLTDLKDEVIDKVGNLPESIRLLFEKKVIDIFENEKVITSFDEYEHYIILKLSEDFSKINGVGVDIFELANNISTDITLRFPNMKIQAYIKKNPGWIYQVSSFVQGLSKIKKKYLGD